MTRQDCLWEFWEAKLFFLLPHLQLCVSRLDVFTIVGGWNWAVQENLLNFLKRDVKSRSVRTIEYHSVILSDKEFFVLCHLSPDEHWIISVIAFCGRQTLRRIPSVRHWFENRVLTSVCRILVMLNSCKWNW